MKATFLRCVAPFLCALVLSACGVVSSGGSQGVEAEAGPDQLVEPGQQVELNAAALVDVDNIDSFQWTQDSGPSVSLMNATTATASFTAPGQRAVLGFTLTTTDEFGAEGEDQVTVTVNVPPTANDDDAELGTDSSVTIDVAANDTDDDALRQGSVTITAQPDNGTVENNGDATVTYTRDGRAGGEATFRYTIDDSNGVASNEATVTVSLGLINERPVAEDDVDIDTVDEGDTLEVPASEGVLDNDTDADGDDLSAVLASGPSNAASFELRDDGSFTYQHDGGETTSDSFTYQADDGFERSEVATVSITVNAINDPPVAVDDDATTNEGTPTSIDLLANDTDPEGGLEPASLDFTPPDNGAVIDNGDGSVTYTPDAGFTGTDTFEYTVQDQEGLTSNSATVTVMVNAAPMVEDDSGTITAVGDPITIDVVDNDTDPDGIDPATVTIATAPQFGTAAPNAAGEVIYTQDSGMGFIVNAPRSDSFTYTVEDELGAVSDVATVTISADPPTSSSACWTVSGGETLAARLDADPGDLDAPLRYSVTSRAGQGRVRLTDAADGAFQYTPNGDAVGSDTFGYEVEDAEGNTRSGEATVITDPRLMPLGGSITAGVTNSANAVPVPERRVGYRKPLQTGLAEAGYAMDFVGSQTFGNGIAGFDYDNEAHIGRSPRALALGSPSRDVNYPNTGVYAWLERSPADFVLLQPGTQSLGSAGVDGVEAILDEIDRYEQDSDTQVRVLLMPGLNPDPEDPRIAAFNDQLAAMAQARAEESDNPAYPDRIVIVDDEDAPAAPADFADSSHPNAAGYEKIAQTWLAAIQASCQAPPNATP